LNNLTGIHNTDESGTHILFQYTMTVPAGKTVKLETNMGTIRIDLAPDMPITAGNFETLVQKGYYNGVIFHRVIDGFMIQGGDPTGTGRGGPG
jgi:peptidylprolyl isomerase